MAYTLLIADDEQMERDALRYIVARGCERIAAVYDAANGREAVEIVEQVHPEIVLLDIKMPGINGVEAAGRILKLAPQTKLVFLTAYDYFDYAQQAVRLGVSDFLVKPASDDRVVEIINKVVAELDRAGRLDEEQHRRDHQLKRTRLALEGALVSGLVRGDSSPEQIEAQLDALELRNRHAVTISMLVDFVSYPMQVETEAQRTVLRRRCVNEVRLALEQRSYTVAVLHGDDVAHFLAVLPSGFEPETGAGEDTAVLGEIVSAAGETIRRKLSIHCTMGVDADPRPISESSEAFRRAAVARNRAAARGEPFGLAGADPVGSVELPEALRLDEIENRLCEAAMVGDEARALELARQALETLFAMESEYRALRRRVMELVIVIARELDLDPGALISKDALVLEQVENAADRDELRHALREAILSISGHRASSGGERSHQRIERARKYIEQQYHQYLSLEDAAAAARLSPYYFTREFKIHTGSTFVDYLNSVRVAHAKRLLRHSTLSVKEIACAVGFSDPNYFSRVFKHHAHTTPTQFRSKTMLH